MASKLSSLNCGTHLRRIAVIQTYTEEGVVCHGNIHMQVMECEATRTNLCDP